MSTNMFPTALPVPPSHGVPDNDIDALFGRGLSCREWETILVAQGYQWIPSLRKIIIRRELYFFKLEIERLLAEPPRATTNGGRSNSCKSVHMRIKGETGEREQRLREGRLFGPEASTRTFEDYVKKWKAQSSSNTSTAALQHSNILNSQYEFGHASSTALLNRDPTISTGVNAQDELYNSTLLNNAELFDEGPSSIYFNVTY